MVLEIKRKCLCPQCGLLESFLIVQFDKKTKQRATKTLQRGFYWVNVCGNCGNVIKEENIY